MADRYILVPVCADDAEAAGITENAVIESYLNGKGEIIIRVASDTDGFVCDRGCGSCPLDSKTCGNSSGGEPYTCFCRTVDPAKGGAEKDEDL